LVSAINRWHNYRNKKFTHLLNAAGEARVFTKMERFRDSVIVEGYEQTFY
jgi:hypothetical protein